MSHCNRNCFEFLMRVNFQMQLILSLKLQLQIKRAKLGTTNLKHKSFVKVETGSVTLNGTTIQLVTKIL